MVGKHASGGGRDGPGGEDSISHRAGCVSRGVDGALIAAAAAEGGKKERSEVGIHRGATCSRPAP